MQLSLIGGGLGRNANIGPKRLIVAYLLDNFLNCDMCICVLSWCYYVKAPEGSSPLVFPETKPIMCFEPDEGDLVIFSSLARHSVPPCKCKEKRIMIAGNIGVKEI